MPISSEQVKDLVALGREQSGVEFKSSGPRTDPVLRAKVIRGMLAMSNRRDGGTVLVGVAESATSLVLDGLSEADALTWKHDSLADAVAEYADPRLVFDSYLIVVDSHSVLVIEVAEFADVPVLCKRSMQDGKKVILRDGAVYVRANRKPESREVANYDEMRELLDIATDRGVRRFVRRARAAGLNADTSGTSQGASRAGDAEAYESERGDL